MKNEKLRELLSEQAESAGAEDLPLFFDNLSFDNSIIGINVKTGQIVYSYNAMISEAMKELDCSEEDAIEWIDYNTLGVLGANPPMPIVVDDFGAILYGLEEDHE